MTGAQWLGLNLATTWLALAAIAIPIANGAEENSPNTNGMTIVESREIDWFVPEVSVVAFSLHISNPESTETTTVKGFGGGVGANIPVNLRLSGYMRFIELVSLGDRFAGVAARTSFGMTWILTGSSLRRRDVVTTGRGARVEAQTQRSGGLRMDVGILYENIMVSQSVGLTGVETAVRWETQIGRLGLFGLGAGVSYSRSPFLTTTTFLGTATWSGT